MRRTIEQERANFCLKRIKSYTGNREKFKSQGMRLAQYIVSNGLISTLAFYKSKDERMPVYEVLNDWLKKKNFVKNDALNELSDADVELLRLATMEAVAFAEWLRRIIEVEIQK